jgi:site-specific recombinase XerD
MECGVSDNTRESYAYGFKLLFEYASIRLKISPSRLTLEQLDAALIAAFLNHLETVRKNRPSSRNSRLAAIKSFMRFIECRVPSALAQVQQIRSIPFKKINTPLARHLTVVELQAILDAPDPHTRDGLRDRAMLHLCFSAGLRVSELVSLKMSDLQLHPSPSIRVFGKGRRERCLPLWRQATTAVRAWVAVRSSSRAPELFLNALGESLTRSGFEYILSKHVRTATAKCPSLAEKQVSPHVLRHTCALTVLQATKDLRKVSLWLGHAHMQTTEVYLRADPSVKLEALEAIVPPTLRTGRFRATDKLIASLSKRAIMRSEIS